MRTPVRLIAALSAMALAGAAAAEETPRADARPLVVKAEVETPAAKTSGDGVTLAMRADAPAETEMPKRKRAARVTTCRCGDTKPD